MNRMSSYRLAFPVCVLGAMASINLSAQIFKTLANLDGIGQPYYFMSLVQGVDGNLYGTTELGGAYSGGSVFKMTPTGTLTTLYSFCAQPDCPDGLGPVAGLVEATDGNLYGTTGFGADGGTGTVFKITPKGAETTVSQLGGQGQPAGALVQTGDGALYGTTGGDAGYLSIAFEVPVPPSDFVTMIYMFCSEMNCDDGDDANALTQATDGNLYGTTQIDGQYGYGTIFRMTQQGYLTTLHAFKGTDGGGPIGTLVQAADGNLYGTTGEGGANGYGTVFKANPDGKLTTLHNFDSTDGAYAWAGLIEATDGNLYGTTAAGGANNAGTIFRITPAGKLTTLYSFCSQPNCADGSGPYGALFQATDGKLYGATVSGGTSNTGTVYSLNLGLGPLVQTVPTSGKVGRSVLILGTNLTGTTSVTFKGTPAVFTVRSKTLIEATVPSAATTGKVEVVTPNGTLSSSLAFRVMQ